VSKQYPVWVMVLQFEVSRLLNRKFTSCLINEYSDGTKWIPHHSDSTIQECPVIVSVSFGATRTFQIKSTIGNFSKDYQLYSGDLFIMSGYSQTYFTHSIIKDPTVTNTRYNITFR
jgi:alkylated DNA repair dioxygenase AlkB